MAVVSETCDLAESWKKWVVDELVYVGRGPVTYTTIACLNIFSMLNDYTKGLIVWPVKISPLRNPILQTFDKGFEISSLFRAK